MNASFLCLGGNIGNRLEFINRAKNLISAKCGQITLQSTVYETRAWYAESNSSRGNNNSPDHLNQCLKLETNLEVEDLLKELLNIEKELGRDRTFITKNDSRIIDIDILLFNEAVINTENCVVPHPRMHLRNFVLVPLNEIVPDLIHPTLNKSVNSLLKECTDTLEVKKITEKEKQPA